MLRVFWWLCVVNILINHINNERLKAIILKTLVLIKRYNDN